MRFSVLGRCRMLSQAIVVGAEGSTIKLIPRFFGLQYEMVRYLARL